MAGNCCLVTIVLSILKFFPKLKLYNNLSFTTLEHLFCTLLNEADRRRSSLRYAVCRGIVTARDGREKQRQVTHPNRGSPRRYGGWLAEAVGWWYSEH